MDTLFLFAWTQSLNLLRSICAFLPRWPEFGIKTAEELTIYNSTIYNSTSYNSTNLVDEFNDWLICIRSTNCYAIFGFPIKLCHECHICLKAIYTNNEKNVFDSTFIWHQYDAITQCFVETNQCVFTFWTVICKNKFYSFYKMGGGHGYQKFSKRNH